MAINKVQFIAYEINTFPIELITGGCLYKGLPDPATDAKARVKLFEDALLAAHADSAWDRNKNTLKIFMAPEFYFRGTRGAYPIENHGVVMAGLKDILKDAMFEGWLFVCGSVIVRWLGDMASTKKAGNATLVQNIVPVIKGGVDEEPRVVIKEHMSGIDFIKVNDKIKRSDFTIADVRHPLAGKPGRFWGNNAKTGSGKESQGLTKYSGLGIFDECGLTFGLEVCLDHALKRLRKSPPGRNQAFVQLQLIPSAGMEIIDEAVVAVKNGLVMNCDGRPRADDDTPMSQCKRVTKACGRLGSDATTTDIAIAKRIRVHPGANCSQLFDDTHGIVRFYARTGIDAITGVNKPRNTNWIFDPY